MRRRGIAVLILVVIAAVLVGVWSVAYRLGDASGRNKVVADRSAFLTQAPSNPQGAAAAGAPGASGGRGAGGSAAAGAGRSGTGGSSVTGQQAAGGSRQSAVGTQSAVGSPQSSVASSVAGRVTAINGATVSVQQADNSTVVVTTDGQTVIHQLVPGVLTDLKPGDVIAVAGGKTAETTYVAQTITSVGQVTGATSAGVGQSLTAVPPGVAAPAVTGQIMSVNGGTLTVQDFNGARVTVTTSPTTIVKTQQSGTLSDIKVGDLLVMQGEKTGATTFLARSVTKNG
ncbi:MAG: DUF5666 domain-containing protein [Chloroflexota bacterium]|nr:DUF5666 domain-containing protein [Chloroflexota bacterium]